MAPGPAATVFLVMCLQAFGLSILPSGGSSMAHRDDPLDVAHAAESAQHHAVQQQAALTHSMGESAVLAARGAEAIHAAAASLVGTVNVRFQRGFASVLIQHALTAVLDGFDADRSCLLPRCGAPFDAVTCGDYYPPGCHTTAGSDRGADTCRTAAAYSSPRLVAPESLEESLQTLFASMRTRIEQVLPSSTRPSRRAQAAAVIADVMSTSARALHLLGRAAGSEPLSLTGPLTRGVTSRDALLQWRMGTNGTEAPLAMTPCQSFRYGPSAAAADVIAAHQLLNRVFIAVGSPSDIPWADLDGGGGGHWGSSASSRSPAERKAVEFVTAHGVASELAGLHAASLSPAANSPLWHLHLVLRNASIACACTPGWLAAAAAAPTVDEPSVEGAHGGCHADMYRSTLRILGQGLDALEQCRVAAWRDSIALVYTAVREALLPALIRLLIAQVDA